MHQTRSFTEPAVGITSVKHRCFQRAARLQAVGEIEWVVTAGHADPRKRILFDGDSPRAAPRERTEPHRTGFFIALAARDRKPGIVLMTGHSAPAFQDRRARRQLR